MFFFFNNSLSIIRQPRDWVPLKWSNAIYARMGCGIPVILKELPGNSQWENDLSTACVPDGIDKNNNNNKKATHPGDKGGNIMGYNVFCSADSHDAHTYARNRRTTEEKRKINAD